MCIEYNTKVRYIYTDCILYYTIHTASGAKNRFLQSQQRFTKVLMLQKMIWGHLRHLLLFWQQFVLEARVQQSTKNASGIFAHLCFGQVSSLLNVHTMDKINFRHVCSICQCSTQAAHVSQSMGKIYNMCTSTCQSSKT